MAVFRIFWGNEGTSPSNTSTVSESSIASDICASSITYISSLVDYLTIDELDISSLIYNSSSNEISSIGAVSVGSITYGNSLIDSIFTNSEEHNLVAYSGSILNSYALIDISVSFITYIGSIGSTYSLSDAFSTLNSIGGIVDENSVLGCTHLSNVYISDYVFDSSNIDSTVSSLQQNTANVLENSYMLDTVYLYNGYLGQQDELTNIGVECISYRIILKIPNIVLLVDY